MPLFCGAPHADPLPCVTDSTRGAGQKHLSELFSSLSLVQVDSLRKLSRYYARRIAGCMIRGFIAYEHVTVAFSGFFCVFSCRLSAAIEQRRARFLPCPCSVAVFLLMVLLLSLPMWRIIAPEIMAVHMPFLSVLIGMFRLDGNTRDFPYVQQQCIPKGDRGTVGTTRCFVCFTVSCYMSAQIFPSHPNVGILGANLKIGRFFNSSKF